MIPINLVVPYEFFFQKEKRKKKKKGKKKKKKGGEKGRGRDCIGIRASYLISSVVLADFIGTPKRGKKGKGERKKGVNAPSNIICTRRLDVLRTKKKRKKKGKGRGRVGRGKLRTFDQGDSGDLPEGRKKKEKRKKEEKGWGKKILQAAEALPGLWPSKVKFFLGKKKGRRGKRKGWKRDRSVGLNSADPRCYRARDKGRRRGKKRKKRGKKKGKGGGGIEENARILKLASQVEARRRRGEGEKKKENEEQEDHDP